MKYFVGGVAATATLYGALYLYNSPPAGQYDTIDKFIVGEIMVTFAFGAIVMFCSRKHWTFRGVGVFLMSLGISIAFALSSLIAYKGVSYDENGKAVSNLDPGLRQGISDLDRSLLFVGGFMFFVGLFDYAMRRLFSRPVKNSVIASEWEPEIVPIVERRNTVRRESDKDLLARIDKLERQEQP